MVDCVFCRIIKGEIPSYKVYEDKKVLAILDLKPVNPGHLLIMPKTHYATLDDMPLTMYKYISGIVYSLYGKLEHELDPDGFNIVQNNEAEAGQLVPHFHIHVIPRYEGDSDFYKNELRARKLSDNEMKEIVKKLSTK